MKHLDTDEYPYVPRARERKAKPKRRKRRSLAVILRDIQRMEGRRVYHARDEAAGQPRDVGLRGLLKSALRQLAPGLYLVQLDGLQCGRITLVDEHFLRRMAVLLHDAYAHRASIEVQVGDFDTWRTRWRRRHRMLKLVHERSERPDLFVEGHACWLAAEPSRPSSQPLGEVYNRLTALAAGRGHQALAPGHPWVDWHHLGRALDHWPFDLLAHVPVSREQIPRLIALCRKHALNSRDIAVAVEELLLINQQIDLIEFLDHLGLLMEGIRRLPDEQNRRLGLLSQAIFYELDDHRLFIRKPGVPAEQYAPHYMTDFIGSVGKYFERVHPEMRVAAEEAPCWSTLFLRLFGIQAPKGWGEREVVLPIDPSFDQLQFLLGQMAKKLPKAKTAVLNKWAGLLSLQAARLAGLTGDTSAPMALSLWLDACRQACTPGPSGIDALQLCIFTNKGALDAIEDKRASAAAYLRILNNESEVLLDRLYHEIGDEPHGLEDYRSELFWNAPMFAVFANPLFHSHSLKDLSEKACFLWLVWVDQKRPERMEHFVEWMQPAFHSEYGLCSFWADIFVDLTPEMRSVFIDLWHTLEGMEGITERQRAMVVHSLAMAAGKGEIQPSFIRSRRTELVQMAGVLLTTCEALEACAGDSYERDLKKWGRIFISAIPTAILWEQRFPGKADGIGTRLVEYFATWLNEGLARKDSEPPNYPLWPLGYLILVRLGGGDFRVYDSLVKASQSSEIDLSELADGWAMTRGKPVLQNLLVAAIAQPNLRKRVFTLFEQLPRIENRLGKRILRDALQAFEQAEAQSVGVESWPEALRIRLARLAAYREILGEDAIPTRLVKVMKTRSIYEGEIRALRMRDRWEHEEARLQKLETWLADPDLLKQRMNQELEKRLAKAIPVDGLSALETVVKRQLEHHWRRQGYLGRDVKNAADWEHAMKFHGEIDSNQRIFRRLLRACAAGDPGRMHRHAVNQRFIQEMKTRSEGEVDRWLQHFELKRKLGSATWRAYTEEDPLQVLKMGTYFDTCLAWDGCNAHSAVANAVEINKRVLYVHDGKTMVGRRLLVLTRSGQLLSFYTYSSASKAPELVKMMLDQLCMVMAAATGYPLVKDVTPFDESCDADHKDIRLFASWYYDSAEDYDSWLHLDTDPKHMPLAELEAHFRAAKTNDEAVDQEWIRFLIAAGTKGKQLAEKLESEKLLTSPEADCVREHVHLLA